MNKPGRLLTYARLDLAGQRVAVAANFADVVGVDVVAGGNGDLDVVLKQLRSRVSAADETRFAEAWRAGLDGAAIVEGELDIKGDDACLRRIEWHASIERAADGTPSTARVSALDATAAQRARHDLGELEARHSSALKAGRMGSWETDLIAMTRRWSPEGLALFGLDASQPDGRVGADDDEFLNALHPDDRHHVAGYYALADEQDSFAAEYRIVRPGGVVVWLAGRGLVLARDAGGKAHRLVSIMADVTERRSAEEDLRIERERLTLALSAGRMGAFDLDIGTDVLWWSPQMYEVFGVSPDSFVPTRESVAGLVHPDDFPKFARLRSDALAHKQAFEIEARILRPDGKLAWVAHRGQSTYDANGKPYRSFGVTMDVTPRKLAEEALREADRKKDDFIATLAHELRNPLAPIRNAITLLRRDAPPGDADASRYRDVIFRQVGQMSRLLEDLLDVSRIARGQVQLRPAWFSLASLFEQAVELAQPAIDAMAHRLEVSLPPEPLGLVGDGLRLVQVFSNLLINAAKYTPMHGHIALTGRLEGDWIVVSVRDDGIGIGPEQMPNIFEMFNQVEDALHRSQGGLGIGLSLARGIVDLHGGRIEASSAGVGKGSTFSVTLPWTSARDEAGSTAVDDSADASSAAIASPLRILVADDVADIAETLAAILASLGHDVRIAHNGIDALESAAAFSPHVALLDLGMPGMSGYDVSRAIRAQAWGHEMTLICQTGWGQEEDRRRSREAGFDHHLVKPLDVDELIALLKNSAERQAGAPRASTGS